MSDKFLIVKKFIDQMDYYGLLAGGAPTDEFDIEIKIISEKVRYDHSVQEIADIIASVFNEYFVNTTMQWLFCLLQNTSRTNYALTMVYFKRFFPLHKG